MKRVIKNNYKFILGVIVGLILSITTVYAVDAYIESNKVSYDNKYTDKTNTQDAINELYERSGIHKEKWLDPVLNGADPVLKEPLIPVEIKPNGEVYYANENSEWYNYSEKRWANAVILVDNPSNTNYQVGNKIEDDDIESYFVWIPRYQYRIWDMGNYTSIIDITTMQNSQEDKDTSFHKMFGNARIIDIKFGNVNTIPKMNESDASLNNYYTHPAFTLGDKDLNGIWVGKFETGYKGATNSTAAQVDNGEPTSVIIKPDVYAWRNITTKNIFMTAYNYKNIENNHNENLDPHMLKNTEYGAIAYLSHSAYGIGTEININNASDCKTGYSSYNADQTSYPGIAVESTDKTKTQPWNTQIGYLASTSGNISGVYDMSGMQEYVAAGIEGKPGTASGFSETEFANYMASGYIDKYAKDSTITSYNKRILGDATGELGPFYSYNEKSITNVYHNSWYADYSRFLDAGTTYLWFIRSGGESQGSGGGSFYFGRHTGDGSYSIGFRIALATR